MSVNSCSRADIHAFVELGVQVGSRLCSHSLAECRTASLRARQTSQSWPATAEDHGGCLDHSERAHCLFIIRGAPCGEEEPTIHHRG